MEVRVAMYECEVTKALAKSKLYYYGVDTDLKGNKVALYTDCLDMLTNTQEYETSELIMEQAAGCAYIYIVVDKNMSIENIVCADVMEIEFAEVEEPNEPEAVKHTINEERTEHSQDDGVAVNDLNATIMRMVKEKEKEEEKGQVRGQDANREENMSKVMEVESMKLRQRRGSENASHVMNVMHDGEVCFKKLLANTRVMSMLRGDHPT